jgi:three-Cys-motif partner protein
MRADDLQHLKQVSRIKHRILTGYLPSWTVILGSTFDLLYYIDCFAGPGSYEADGEMVDGSPIIAVNAGKEFAIKHVGKRLGIVLVDDDDGQLRVLKESLKRTEPYPFNLKVQTRLADSRAIMPRIVDRIRTRRAPTFFLVDPYGHPLSVPVLNDVLALPRSELFINLMWYRINMDMSNTSVAHHVDEMFGNDAWREQGFTQQHGIRREKSFMRYFEAQLAAQYVLPFRIQFDAAEDANAANRTKYYLLHASNSLKAVLLMKEVMWPLGDEEGTFDFSGTSQGVLISQSPQTDELKKILLREFDGQALAFDDIRGKTWALPFIEKHYRSVLQELRSEGAVKVTAVTSKGKGLAQRDLVHFPHAG